MALFKSKKERRLWIWTVLTLFAIFSTLFIGRPLAKLLSSQDVQAIIFSIVMLLIGTTIVLHALKFNPGKLELTIWLGIVSVYVMLFLRLGLPERSHLMEYSILAIFMQKAFVERFKPENLILKPAMYAFGLAIIIGILDEWIQRYLPNRSYDPEDIIFNTIAVSMAIGTSLFLTWLRSRGKKPKNP